jgi:hypothetical protein
MEQENLSGAFDEEEFQKIFGTSEQSEVEQTEEPEWAVKTRNILDQFKGLIK